MLGIGSVSLCEQLLVVVTALIFSQGKVIFKGLSLQLEQKLLIFEGTLHFLEAERKMLRKASSGIFHCNQCHQSPH